MADKSEIRCPTPRCAQAFAADSQRGHRVYVRQPEHSPEPRYLPGTVAECEGCGGHTDGQVWRHRCCKCSQDVAPGLLTGLFVPHSCRPCHAALEADQRAKGQICSGCRKPSCWCCC